MFVREYSKHVHVHKQQICWCLLLIQQLIGFRSWAYDLIKSEWMSYPQGCPKPWNRSNLLSPTCCCTDSLPKIPKWNAADSQDFFPLKQVWIIQLPQQTFVNRASETHFLNHLTCGDDVHKNIHKFLNANKASMHATAKFIVHKISSIYIHCIFAQHLQILLLA